MTKMKMRAKEMVGELEDDGDTSETMETLGDDGGTSEMMDTGGERVYNQWIHCDLIVIF